MLGGGRSYNLGHSGRTSVENMVPLKFQERCGLGNTSIYDPIASLEVEISEQSRVFNDKPTESRYWGISSASRLA